jgi:hypothetical protein
MNESANISNSKINGMSLGSLESLGQLEKALAAEEIIRKQ